MYAALSLNFFLQQRIYHSVSGRLHLRLERVRHNVYTTIQSAFGLAHPGHGDARKMCLARRTTDHSLVVRVLVRVIPDLQARWL